MTTKLIKQMMNSEKIEIEVLEDKLKRLEEKLFGFGFSYKEKDKEFLKDFIKTRKEAYAKLELQHLNPLHRIT